MSSDSEIPREDQIAKSDRAAATYSSARYVDPEAIARRQLELLRDWGRPVPPGSRVLELGCADGFVTVELARAGYRVTAVDFSPAMIGVARDRLSGCRDLVDLHVADVGAYRPEGDYDAVLGLMWTFFTYVPSAGSVLRRLAISAPKILVDIDPRRDDLPAAISLLRASGFREITSRPIFIPQRYRLQTVSRLALRAAERTPGLREAILKHKFEVVLKGER